MNTRHKKKIYDNKIIKQEEEKEQRGQVNGDKRQSEKK